MQITTLLGDRVLIEPYPEQTHVGGVELPQKARIKNPLGVVRLVGTGKRERSEPDMLELKPGQIVRVDHKFGSVDVQFDGRLHRIHSIMDVQAIFE